MSDILNELDFLSFQKEVAELDLLEFTKFMWGVIEPARELKVNWHLEAIAEHLEAVSRGDIKRLIINVPPRTSKSTLCSVMWQPWEWLQQPQNNWLYVSAAERVAVRDALKSREIINSNIYRALWGDRFDIVSDQNQKTSIKNNKAGTRNVFGITSTVTGENADRLVIDDPNNADDARSPAMRLAVAEAWDNKLRTRLNDIQDSSIVLIQQRIHAEDLTGIFLHDNSWERLILPMEYDGKQRSRTSLNFKDKRAEGEILDPNRFPKDSLEALKQPRLDDSGAVVGGATFYATQYQQEPQVAEGGLVRRDWWRWHDPEEVELRPICKSYDTAFKEKEENDPSACTTWAMKDGVHYITDIWEGRLNYPDLRKHIIDDYDATPVPEVLIEDKASGQSLLQEFSRIRTTRGHKLPLKAMMPNGSTKDANKAQFAMPASKMERVHFVASIIEAGLISLPKGHPLSEKLVDQFAQFPNGAHDDILDTVTQRIIRHLNRRVGVTKRGELL